MNKRWKYYCNERPASPGAVPRDGLLEVCYDSSKSRYGYVIYNRELMDHEVVEYELLPYGELK